MPTDDYLNSTWNGMLGNNDYQEVALIGTSIDILCHGNQNGCHACFGDAAMSALTLKNLPDALLDRLRKRAVRERRSMNGEVVHLLNAALRGESAGADPALRAREQAAAWRRLAGRWESDVDAATEAAALRRARSGGRKVAW